MLKMASNMISYKWEILDPVVDSTCFHFVVLTVADSSMN